MLGARHWLSGTTATFAFMPRMTQLTNQNRVFQSAVVR